MNSTSHASLEQMNVSKMLLRVQQWIRHYEGNPNAKNYRAICLLMAARSLPTDKLANLVHQVNASKHNAPHWLASLFFRGRSEATQRAYTELEGILGMSSFSSGAIKSKGEESEEFGVRIEIPSYMRCYIPENRRASEVGLGR